MQLSNVDATKSKKINLIFAHENMKKQSSKVAHSLWLKIFFRLLSWAAHMAQNWKSMLEIGLRHSLLYLLCG